MDPLWLVPLPAGEPRRLGDLRVANADIFPDGRIVFAKLVPGTDAKGTDGRADWFIAEKGGLNPRELVSFGLCWIRGGSAHRSAHSPHSGASR